MHAMMGYKKKLLYGTYGGCYATAPRILCARKGSLHSAISRFEVDQIKSVSISTLAVGQGKNRCG